MRPRANNIVAGALTLSAVLILATEPARAQSDLPPQVQALLARARAANPQRYQFALDRGARIAATADGRSFYLLWTPPGAPPDGRTTIVTLHGSESWAFDEFFLWYEAALGHGHGILALQWWFPGETVPREYYAPGEVYAALEPALRQQGVQPRRALLHGFSRASANGYYVALFDRVAGNNFFALCVANAGGASVGYPHYTEVVSGRYGAAPFEGLRWTTYCGGLDPNPDRDGCPAMRRTADFIRQYGGNVDLAIEDPGKGHGGFHQTPLYLDLALTAFDSALLASGTAWAVRPDQGFRISGASIPNVGWMKDEVWLTVGGTGGIRLFRSAAGDNATRGEQIPGFGTALSGTGYSPTETVPRVGADGTRELYVLGLGAPGTNNAVVFRLRENPAGQFLRDPQGAIFSGENQFVGVPDVFAAADGKPRMIYVARGAARQNSRTALSADGGRSFAAEYDNPFNDLNVTQPGASNTNVDPAALKLAQGGYLAATMRAKKLYLFFSADGRVFLPVARIEGQEGALDAARLFPNGTGFFDPTLVQLPDGRIWMYVTLEQGAQPEAVVRVELAPVPGIPPIRLPRLVSTDTEFTGVALVNPADYPANLSFTTRNDDGSTAVASPPWTNPFETRLPSKSQFVRTIGEMFGSGFRTSGAWLEITSDRSDTIGLFMTFDAGLQAMDGAALNGRPAADIVLPEAREAELSLVNPSSTQAADVAIRLVADSGVDSGGPVNRRIPPRGRFSARVAELFPGAASGYLRVASTAPLAAMEVFGSPGSSIAALVGLEAEGGTRRVFAPQYAAGAGYRSSVAVVNLENSSSLLSFTWTDDSGSPIGRVLTFPLPASGRFVLDDPTLFQATLPAEGLQGYLSVSSSATRIAGAVLFGDPAGTRFQTALPLVDAGRTDALFAQAVQNELYFTGLAAVNPNDAPVTASISILNSEGTTLRTVSETIPPNGRLARLLSQLAPELPALNSGYVRIRASLPMVSFAVFGTHTLTALSAIPAQ